MVDNFTCPVCLETAQNAVESSCCGNLFCETHSSEIQVCPLCRQRPFVCTANQFARRAIRDLHTAQPCPMACGQRIARSQLDEHRLQCANQIAHCPGAMCEFAGRMSQLAEHIAQRHTDGLIIGPSAPPPPPVSPTSAAQPPSTLQSCDNVDSPGLVLLGNNYFYGNGIPQSYNEALLLYRRAAEQGDAWAQYNVGYMLENGLVTSRSDSEAAEWYRRSAENGNTQAQNSLGLLYQSGRGVTQSDAEACRWFRTAAEHGHAAAQNNFGLMHRHGRAVRRSDVDACHWYRKAAEQGHVLAQANLGLMYRYGRGVQQSNLDAASWLHKAAIHGHALSQYNLAVLYENGLGVRRSKVDAALWFKKAAEQGDAEAKIRLDRLQQSCTLL